MLSIRSYRFLFLTLCAIAGFGGACGQSDQKLTAVSASPMVTPLYQPETKIVHLTMDGDYTLQSATFPYRTEGNPFKLVSVQINGEELETLKGERVKFEAINYPVKKGDDLRLEVVFNPRNKVKHEAGETYRHALKLIFSGDRVLQLSINFTGQTDGICEECNTVPGDPYEFEVKLFLTVSDRDLSAADQKDHEEIIVEDTITFYIDKEAGIATLRGEDIPEFDIENPTKPGSMVPIQGEEGKIYTGTYQDSEITIPCVHFTLAAVVHLYTNLTTGPLSLPEDYTEGVCSDLLAAPESDDGSFETEGSPLDETDGTLGLVGGYVVPEGESVFDKLTNGVIGFEFELTLISGSD